MNNCHNYKHQYDVKRRSFLFWFTITTLSVGFCLSEGRVRWMADCLPFLTNSSSLQTISRHFRTTYCKIPVLCVEKKFSLLHHLFLSMRAQSASHRPSFTFLCVSMWLYNPVETSCVHSTFFLWKINTQFTQRFIGISKWPKGSLMRLEEI